jgi:hypothetical protein
MKIPTIPTNTTNHRTTHSRMRKRDQIGRQSLALAAALALAAPLPAQTHKVAKTQDVVRAVGVYEWTGDMAKPAASRLIPVSLFIDGRLQDAGVYLASPVPFALLTGNVYELQKSGKPVGTLDLAFAKHLIAPENATTTYDDGWFGYGKFFPPAPPKKSTLKPTVTLAKINGIDDEDDDKPHFSSRSAAPGSGGAAAPAGGTTTATINTPTDDPDRPTLHRSGGGPDSSGSGSPGATPADDPDRPTLHRTSGGDSTASSGSGNTPADDPDRPTLRRRSPDANSGGNHNAVTPVANSLNDDPNRPTLHRGKPVESMTDADIPKLNGLPGDQELHQMVAVSDAANHPPHDFTRPWDDDAERQAILAKLQTAARAQLTAYETANAAVPAKPAPAAKAPTARTRRAAVKPAPVPEPAPEALLDEQLMGYTLSYGGAATFVYHAHTDGLGPALRFVTLVAQVNMQGEPEIAMKNVTDAAHLDRTPRMRLVDAVDAEASNRASLLFELRAQNSRQFALYRVIGGQATQTFVTGSTQ